MHDAAVGEAHTNLSLSPILLSYRIVNSLLPNQERKPMLELSVVSFVALTALKGEEFTW